MLVLIFGSGAPGSAVGYVCFPRIVHFAFATLSWEQLFFGRWELLLLN